MFVVLPLVNKKKVTLFDYTKKIGEFDSLVEFVKSYSKYDINERLGSEVPKQEYHWMNGWGFRTAKTWTIVDYYGRIIHPNELKAAYDTDEYRMAIWKRVRRNSYGFRNLGSYSRTRKPRTTNERRQVLSYKDDESPVKIKYRAARNHLPNSWDDVQSGKLHRNWKRYRQHQWNS